VYKFNVSYLKLWKTAKALRMSKYGAYKEIFTNNHKAVECDGRCTKSYHYMCLNNRGTIEV